MKKVVDRMKKILLSLWFLLIPLPVLAENITDSVSILVNNEKLNKITDNNENSYATINANKEITITSETDISGIYIIYELNSQKGAINYNEKSQNLGANNFLHEYVKLEEKTKEAAITYETEVKIAEIYVLSEGELPDFVEVWNPPFDKADLLLFSTHSDDEQLFFLRLIPTYVARGANVQVVYFTNHFDNPKRLHEQLHGLYTVGIRNYPIIGIIPDAWSTNLDGAIKNMNKSNLTEDDALKYEVENIRRFKPLVIVGHDENGEYSHGQHILNTYILKQAILKANDATYDAESLNNYGLWDTPKLYLHLYKENPIVMDYDTPLAYFDGKTAYEVSKEGYSKHLSQQWTWFTAWILGKNKEFTKATEIKTYSPLEFGLYRSLVGEDITKNDMFENLTLRKDEVQEEETKEENVKTEKKEKKNNIKDFILPLALIASSLVLLIIILLLKRKK